LEFIGGITGVEAMQNPVAKGLRYFFYFIIGASLVLVTTPSLAHAFPGASAFFLWPLTGLLAYLLHLFEDTGKLSDLLRPVRSVERRAAASSTRLSRLSAGSSGRPAEQL
jgi:hypothetical protein